MDRLLKLLPLILLLILSSEGQQQEYSSVHILDREGPQQSL
jgi:hypothetical protein